MPRILPSDPVIDKYLKRDLVPPVGATQLTRDLKLFTKPEIETLHRFVSSIAIAELEQSYQS